MAFEDPDDPEKYADAVRAAEAAALRAAEREDDEKARAGRDAGGGMGNPADADLSANIRPDVVAAPGGLVTITTAKSATYHPEPASEEHAAAAHEVRYLNEWTNAPHDEDPAANEAWSAATSRLAEMDRRTELEAGPAIEGEPPAMFLEDRDEWTKPPSYDELIAGMADKFEGTPSGEIFKAMKEPEQSNAPQVLTREAIFADPWNAVALDLPEKPDMHLLHDAKAAIDYVEARELYLMEVDAEYSGHHEELRVEARAARHEVAYELQHAQQYVWALNVLRDESPTEYVGHLLEAEDQEFGHTPAQGPIAEALHTLYPNGFEENPPGQIRDVLRQFDPEWTEPAQSTQIDAPEMSADEYISMRIAEPDAVEAEDASRHNEQQAESARPAEASREASGDRPMTADEFISMRIAEAKAEARERGEQDVGPEINHDTDTPQGPDGRDIF